MNAKRPAPLREEAKQSFPDTPRDGDSPLLLITSHTVLVDSAFPEIMAAARERNWRVLDLALIENELPHAIVPRLAMIAADALHNRLCNRLKRMGCGVVRVGNAAHRAASGAPAVGDNFAEEGRLAAEHFAERNFRYVAFPVWGEPTLRFEAFRARATELGCTCHPLAIKSWSTREGESWSRFQKRRYWLYFDAFRKWARSVPRPIGLACPTDVLGARYIHMARQLGFRVPHDIAILGRGDMPHICECALVPLSSIRVNFKSHVNTAFRLLDRMLAGEAAPPQPFEVPPGGITVRASTDMQAAGDPRTAEALRFIWSHYGDVDLSVDDIARAAGVSRRRLQDLVRSDLGETIVAVLARRRLERCRYLLATTDTTVTDLCRHVGFRSKEHLHRVFKHRHGMTPLQYRAAQRAGSSAEGSQAP